ncbi:hypothetical protein M231_02166 [Tremella mesenterica]|uniref:Alpha-1,6-mannosyltransferase n=1 Tax=Tremella mesenterica TaxID=5217 RepID=A0A4Q1BRD3_TREME|nr:hypothetical protein M231_02166 [Tremella mesenterica]
MARYTPTRLLISLLAVLSLLIFLIHSPSSSPIQALRTRSFPYARWIEDWTTQPPRAQNPLTAPPSTWAQAYEDERMSLLEEKNYDAEWMAWAIGTPEHNQLGGNLTAYLDRLNRFVDTYFEGSPSKPALKQMLRNLGHHVPPPLLDQPMRRKVFSTCKGGKEEVPEGFNQWERRLGPVGWEVEVADDDRMQEWFSDAIKGDGFGLGEEKFRRIWDALPKQVLRSDLLRYLMILIHGGIYTDSDTQPRSHPFLWGTDAQSLMPPSLKAINRMLQSYSRHPAYDDLSIEPQTPESPWNYADSYHGGIGDDDVAFVASIEWDSFERELGENWCCGYCRALQVVQWTIMVSTASVPCMIKPDSHPNVVLLDSPVISSAKKIENKPLVEQFVSTE